jgi:hypothetical protein
MEAFAVEGMTAGFDFRDTGGTWGRAASYTWKEACAGQWDGSRGKLHARCPGACESPRPSTLAIAALPRQPVSASTPRSHSLAWEASRQRAARRRHRCESVRSRAAAARRALTTEALRTSAAPDLPSAHSRRQPRSPSTAQEHALLCTGGCAAERRHEVDVFVAPSGSRRSSSLRGVRSSGARSALSPRPARLPLLSSAPTPRVLDRASICSDGAQKHCRSPRP